MIAAPFLNYTIPCLSDVQSFADTAHWRIGHNLNSGKILMIGKEKINEGYDRAHPRKRVESATAMKHNKGKLHFKGT